jgi:hypothetical protein
MKGHYPSQNKQQEDVLHAKLSILFCFVAVLEQVLCQYCKGPPRWSDTI